jgi:hypothetical protein
MTEEKLTDHERMIRNRDLLARQTIGDGSANVGQQLGADVNTPAPQDAALDTGKVTERPRQFELLAPDNVPRISGRVESMGQAMLLADALLSIWPDHTFRYQYRLCDSASIGRKGGAWTYVRHQTLADFNQAEAAS